MTHTSDRSKKENKELEEHMARQWLDTASGCQEMCLMGIFAVSKQDTSSVFSSASLS